MEWGEEIIQTLVCPFCETEGGFEFKEYVDSEPYKYQVMCFICGVGGPIAYGLEDSAAKNNAALEMLKFLEVIENEKC